MAMRSNWKSRSRPVSSRHRSSELRRQGPHCFVVGTSGRLVDLRAQVRGHLDGCRYSRRSRSLVVVDEATARPMSPLRTPRTV